MFQRTARCPLPLPAGAGSSSQQFVKTAVQVALAQLGTGINRDFIVLVDPSYLDPPKAPFPPLPLGGSALALNGTTIGTDPRGTERQRHGQNHHWHIWGHRLY